MTCSGYRFIVWCVLDPLFGCSKGMLGHGSHDHFYFRHRHEYRGGIGGFDLALLAVEDLSISFGVILALDSVSFSVEQGEILSIIGPNGAGHYERHGPRPKPGGISQSGRGWPMGPFRQPY